MSQMEMTAPPAVYGPVGVIYASATNDMIVIRVEGNEDHALRAAMAGIRAYNADPTFLDPAANKEGPSPRGKSTSKSAAWANYPRSGSQRERILSLLISHPNGGLTREEIETMAGLDGSTVRPRVLELISGGWAQETAGRRRTRKGNESVVVIPTKKAMEWRG